MRNPWIGLVCLGLIFGVLPGSLFAGEPLPDEEPVRETTTLTATKSEDEGEVRSRTYMAGILQLKNIDHKDKKLKESAVSFFQKGGARFAPILLLGMLSHQKSVVQKTSSKLLCALKDKNAMFLPQLQKGLETQSYLRSWLSSRVLAAIGSAAIPVLQIALSSKKSHVRAYAGLALGMIGGLKKETLEVLLKGLKDSDKQVRWYTLVAFESLGKQAVGVLPQMSFLLKDKDRYVRRRFVRWLGELGALARPLVPELLSSLTEEKAVKLRNLSIERQLHSTLEKILPKKAKVPKKPASRGLIGISSRTLLGSLSSRRRKEIYPGFESAWSYGGEPEREAFGSAFRKSLLIGFMGTTAKKGALWSGYLTKSKRVRGVFGRKRWPYGSWRSRQQRKKRRGRPVKKFGILKALGKSGGFFGGGLRGFGGGGLRGRGLRSRRKFRGMDRYSRRLIARVIRRHLTKVRYCYERSLKKNPRLSGKVTVWFTISSSGRVKMAKVLLSTLKNHVTEACLVRSILRWKFPRPRWGNGVSVKYPFVFRPAVRP